ncbi:DsbA family protein [Nocardioides hwasunensis]|uniref:Thioredoxin domain-containing protein n=1 Tax=Nocardioides hwasunensis TaxID=397258 RepID=A0ABR8MEG2_9ACTN|nr:thioredoxin domain-containing protein [Nocardioides hwasunensis]MBD3913050.1 thioredoxin domain-containing protein [Nocardioides hwasunensis]
MAQKKSRTPEEKAAAQARREQRQSRNERAKALAEERRKAAKRKQQMSRFGIVAAVLVLLVGGYFLVTNLGSDKPDTAPQGASASYGLVVGEDDAPKSIVIYEDFLCPFCGQLEATVGDQLNAAIEAGEVKVEYRPIPFLSRVSDYSPEAANAFAVVLNESGPEVAKEFHDLLYANQPEERGPYPSTDDIVDLAVEAGATEADVRPGIEDMAFEGWVDAAADAAGKADVTATPTVLIDGQRATGQTMQDLANEILAGTGGAGGS